MNNNSQTKKPTFILSDQSINCYGFIILTDGIDVEGFRKNPIMLYNHINEGDPSDAIGTWENIRVEDHKLLAEPNIDEDDDFSKRVFDKVSNGIIKAASINVHFIEDDVEMRTMGASSIPVILKCKLTEVSICPIPGNSNAIRLFNNGKQITSVQLANTFKSHSIPTSVVSQLNSNTNLRPNNEVKRLPKRKVDTAKLKSVISGMFVDGIITFDDRLKLNRMLESNPEAAFSMFITKLMKGNHLNLRKSCPYFMNHLQLGYPALAKYIVKKSLNKTLSAKEKRIGLHTVNSTGLLINSAFGDGIINAEEKELYFELINYDENLAIDVENDILILVQDWNYQKMKASAPAVLNYLKDYYPNWYEQIISPYIDSVKKSIL